MPIARQPIADMRSSAPVGLLASVMLLAGCGADQLPPPPPYLAVGGLPVSGSLADAKRAGFDRCVELGRNLRCRRDKVMVEGQGPYGAAVDLGGNDGRGGFRELTLWHETNQYSLYAVRDALRAKGWQSCITGEGRKGDQMIFTRAGASVRYSMDISYWGKRRLRIMPQAGQPKPDC